MITALTRWANRQHTGALAGFLTGAIPLSLGLWATAVLNWPMATVALMGIAALLLIVVYTAPLTLGLTALATRFSLKSIFELFLMLWIIIACYGSVAMIDGLMNIGWYYPLHIFFLSAIVAALVRSGAVNLEFWMKVIAAGMTVLMIVVTIAATPKHVLTSGVAGPEAVAAADARDQAARTAADQEQTNCINALPGNYTREQAYQKCPLHLGVQAVAPVPQAPRKLSALEQDAFTLNTLNQGALDAETTTCIQFLREIVEGYQETKEQGGHKIAARSLKASDYESDVTDKDGNVLCSKGTLTTVKKLQKDVAHAQATQAAQSASPTGFAARQEEVINQMANTLPDWMPDWLKAGIAWSLAVLAAHGVYFAIAAAIGALLLALGLRKKSTVATATTTTTIAAKESAGNGWKTLAVVMILAGVGYAGWNNNTVSKAVSGALTGASRGMSEAETPVWNKLLTRDFVKAHGTKAFALGSEYDVVLDDNGRISLQQNGNEVYAMGQQDPCSDPIPTQFEGGKHTLATCSGKWKAGGSSYGTSYGTWVGKLNATHNGMIRVAYLSYSADPNRAPVEVWFR